MPVYAQDGLEAIKAAGKIRVALEFGRPPWGFKDDALKPTGSDYETAALLARISLLSLRLSKSPAQIVCLFSSATVPML